MWPPCSAHLPRLLLSNIYLLQVQAVGVRVFPNLRSSSEERGLGALVRLIGAGQCWSVLVSAGECWSLLVSEARRACCRLACMCVTQGGGTCRLARQKPTRVAAAQTSIQLPQGSAHLDNLAHKDI